ncbi:hypothetical protein [Pseudokordiimonas caeni]|uniref:hypothetical protein n=1 Tax=Pseudokordiimonas caeni TaxID=2997908 RepID=UPI00281162F2|nr:hypothetical protein [Pseudokordiimonas caeni]
MLHDDHHIRRQPPIDGTMGLFVSLYLILLAFFIVLNAVSNHAPAKAVETMDSVSGTFSAASSPVAPPGLDPAEQTAPTDDLLTSIKGEFFAEMAIEGRFTGAGGRILELDIPVSALFSGVDTEVRSDRKAFLGRILGMLKGASARQRQQVLFLFGNGEAAVTPKLTRGQEIAIRRSGSLARFLRDAGLEGGTYGAGFAAHAEDRILVVFRPTLASGADVDLSASEGEFR